MDNPYGFVLFGDNYVVFSLEEGELAKCVDNRKQCHAANAKGKNEHVFTKPTRYPPHT